MTYDRKPAVRRKPIDVAGTIVTENLNKRSSEAAMTIRDLVLLARALSLSCSAYECGFKPSEKVNETIRRLEWMIE